VRKKIDRSSKSEEMQAGEWISAVELAVRAQLEGIEVSHADEVTLTFGLGKRGIVLHAVKNVALLDPPSSRAGPQRVV
jgi:RecA/RadA recombinase